MAAPFQNEIVDGFRFKGGDPADQNSWEPFTGLKPGDIQDGFTFRGGDAAKQESWERGTSINRTWTEAITDTARDATAGTLEAASGLTGLFRRAGSATQTGQANLSDIETGQSAVDTSSQISQPGIIEKALSGTADVIRDEQSDKRKWQRQALQDTDGAWEAAKFLVTNPSAIGGLMAESAPGSLLAGGVGGLVGKTALAAGASKAAAISAAGIGAMAGEGILSAGSLASDIEKLLDQQGIMDPEVRSKAINIAYASGLATGYLGKIGKGIEVMPFMRDSIKESLAKAVPKAMLKEGAEEFAQSFQETVAKNLALGQAGAKDADGKDITNLTQGAAKEATVGAIAGIGTGGVMPLASRGLDKLQPTPPDETPPTPTPSPDPIKSAGPILAAPDVDTAIAEAFKSAGIRDLQDQAIALDGGDNASELVSGNTPATQGTSAIQAAGNSVPQTPDAVQNAAENLPAVDAAARTDVAQKTPPIVRFREEAKAIEAQLPPAAAGYIRMWRGNRDGEVGTATRFTNDLAGIALPFRDAYKGQLSYVDIKAEDASKYLQTGTVATGAEFILPPDVSKKATSVAKLKSDVAQKAGNDDISAGRGAAGDILTAANSGVSSADGQQTNVAAESSIGPSGQSGTGASESRNAGDAGLSAPAVAKVASEGRQAGAVSQPTGQVSGRLNPEVGGGPDAAKARVGGRDGLDRQGQDKAVADADRQPDRRATARNFDPDVADALNKARELGRALRPDSPQSDVDAAYRAAMAAEDLRESREQERKAPKFVDYAEKKGKAKGEIKFFSNASAALKYKGNKKIRGYAPRETADGWVLSKPFKPRSEKQLANDAKKKAKTEPIDILRDELQVALRKMGGIDIDEALASGFDKADIARANIPGFGNRKLFRKGGMSLDAAREAIAQGSEQAGYLDPNQADDPNHFIDRLMDSVKDQASYYSFAGQEYQLAMSEAAKEADRGRSGVQLDREDQAEAGIDSLPKQAQNEVQAAWASIDRSMLERIYPSDVIEELSAAEAQRRKEQEDEITTFAEREAISQNGEGSPADRTRSAQDDRGDEPRSAGRGDEGNTDEAGQGTRSEVAAEPAPQAPAQSGVLIPGMSDGKMAQLRSASEPALDIDRKPNGWLLFRGNDEVALVHPDKNEVRRFDYPANSGTGRQRAIAYASAFAQDNPVAAKALPKGELEIQPIFRSKGNANSLNTSPERVKETAESAQVIASQPESNTPANPLIAAADRMTAAAERMASAAESFLQNQTPAELRAQAEAEVKAKAEADEKDRKAAEAESKAQERETVRQRSEGAAADFQLGQSAMDNLTGQKSMFDRKAADKQTDTPEFRAWFKDSKVVDVEGNPLVVYHGSPNDFNIFDIDRLNNRSEGPGFYFTTNIDVASGYGEPKAVYLSIQKPLAYDAKPFKAKELSKLFERIAKLESEENGGDIRDGFLANYGDTYTGGIAGAIREAVNLTSDEESAVDQISGIVGSGVSAKIVLRAVTEVTGYDGIAAKGFSNEGDGSNTIYVAFAPTQIKSATSNSGQFDPNNPDIRFSRKVADEKDLIVQHNLTAANLYNVDRMGGMAVPSLAITKASSPLENFGEITLIGPTDMADPKGYANTRVFGADIYSPRYPQVNYRIADKDLSNLGLKLSEGIKATESKIDVDELERNGAEGLEKQPAAMYQFLRQEGIEPKIIRDEGPTPKAMAALKKAGLLEYAPTKGEYFDKFSLQNDPEFQRLAYEENRRVYKDAGLPKEGSFDSLDDGTKRNIARTYTDTLAGLANIGQVIKYRTTDELRNQISKANLGDKFAEYAQDLFDSMNAQGRIFKGFNYAGNRSYTPHNLENVVKILKKELRGGENFNYGAGSLRARFTPQFRSLAEIKKNKERLVSKEDFDAVKTEVDGELVELAGKLSPFYGGDSNRFGYLDSVVEMLGDSAKMGMSRALTENLFTEVDPEVIAEARDFLGKLRNLPTEYFEAKILRSVSLPEFAAAVIPTDTPQKARKILEKNGIQVFEYKPNDLASRTAAVKKAAESKSAMFSRQPKQAQSIQASDARAATEVITKKWKNAPKITVHESLTSDSVPAGLRNAMEKEGVTDARGAWYAGEIHLFPSNIGSLAELERTIVHEARHYGLEGLFGKDMNPILMEIYMKDKGVRTEANRLVKTLKVSTVDAVNETLANMPLDAAKKLPGWQKLIAKLKAWLNDRGFTNLAKMLEGPSADAITKDILYQVEQFVKTGKRSDTTFTTTLFSKSAAGLPQSEANDAGARGDNPRAGQGNNGDMGGELRGMEARDGKFSRTTESPEELDELLREYGEPVESLMEADKRIGDGDRVFVSHEMDEGADIQEISGSDELVGYTAEQVIVLSRFLADRIAENEPKYSRTDQTESPAFKRWFGNSAVVDSNGKPLIVFHGTDQDFNEFTFKLFGRTDAGARGKGFYFSESPEYASNVATSAASGGMGEANVMPVYLSIKKPLVWDEKAQAKFNQMTVKDFTDWAKQQGYDGVHNTKSNEWLAFRPEQIKSAIGNSGDFSPSNPDIRYSRTAADFDPSRRNFMMGTAALLASGNAKADVTLGKAKPIDAAILGQKVSPSVEKILRGNGATNPAGAKALKQAINQIYLTGPKELRALAQQIAALLPESGVMLTVNDRMLANAHGAVSLSPIPHLTLFTAENRKGLSYDTVLHEALHVAVAARYRALSSGLVRSNDAKLKIAAPAASAEMQQFRDLWTEFGSLVARDKSIADPALKLSLKESASDPDEFFVRAMTDPVLQKYMAGKEYQGKTMFERFKDWVKSSLLGFSKSGTAPSWLDAALAATGDLNVAMVKDRADFARLNATNAYGESGKRSQLFSRTAADAPNETKGAANAYTTKKLASMAIGGKMLGEIVKNPSKFNWINKTLNTQLHKGLKNKEFGKVVWATQQFMEDVSQFATQAADFVPDILPNLGNTTHAVKWLKELKNPAKLFQKKKDLKDAGRMIFEGTMAGGGNPMEGRLYSEADLKAKGLTDRAIEYYQQARQAIDKSINDLVMSDVIRMIGTRIDLDPGRYDVFKVDSVGTRPTLIDAIDQSRRDAVKVASAAKKAYEKAKQDREYAQDLNANFVKRQERYTKEGGIGRVENASKAEIESLTKLEAKAESLMKKEAKRLDTWTDIQNKVEAAFKQADGLQAAGYAPLMRFGKLWVRAVKGGETLHRAHYENRLDLNAAKAEMRKAFPDATIETGIQSDLDWQRFKGMTPETIMLFAETLGLNMDEHQAAQQWYQEAVSSRSTLKRHIKRDGIPGFSDDLSRVLAGFITSNSRRASVNYNMPLIQQAQEAINKNDGDIRDEASKLIDQINNPTEDAAALRGIMYAWFIGGSVASAAVNFTQPLTMTLPYLGQWGNAKASLALAKALRLKLPEHLQAAKKLADEKGITNPQEVYYLYNEAIRGVSSNKNFQTAMWAWGAMFSFAENMNRRTTFLASYDMWENADAATRADMVKVTGASNAFDFAKRVIQETQGIYNKANRPNWARGAVGATVFTFKQYGISYLEFVSRLPTKQKAMAAAILILMAGLQGLPGAEDLEDIIDTLGQMMGYRTNSKDFLRQKAIELLGETAGAFLMTGLFNQSGRLGLGNLIPGTAMFKRSETDRGDDLGEAVGPIGSLGKNVLQAFDEAQAGDYEGAITSILPKAMGDFRKGKQIWDTGAAKDFKNRDVVQDLDKGDALLQGIGFNPGKKTDATRESSAKRQDANQVKDVQSDIVQLWAEGIAQEDDAKMERASNMLESWNEKNPEASINRGDVIDSALRRRNEMGKSREERQQKTLPKSLRGYYSDR